MDTISKSVQSASLHCTLVCICASLLKLLIFFLFRSLYTFHRFLFPRRLHIYTYRRKLRNNFSLDEEYNYIKNRLAFIKKQERALQYRIFLSVLIFERMLILNLTRLSGISKYSIMRRAFVIVTSYYLRSRNVHRVLN